MDESRLRAEKERLEIMANEVTNEIAIDYYINKQKVNNDMIDCLKLDAQLDRMYEEELNKFDKERKHEGFFQKFDRWVRG